MTDTLQKKITTHLTPALLACAVLLLYFPSLFFGFIWDDYTYILDSPLMSDPLGLVKIWTSHSTADFWPLSYSVLWLLKQFFGAVPFAYHGLNLFLYGLSVVLIFKVLQALRFKSAGWIALLFAVHPMNVEVAVWIFQIKTNLANVFGLAACLYWIRYVDSPDRKAYFLTVLFLILSHLAKISLVTLPILFLLYYHVKNLHQPGRKIILTTAPFFALSFVFGIMNVFWDQNSFPTVASELILEDSPLFRFALIGNTYWFYFMKTFWPDPLTLVHPRFALDLDSIKTYIPSVCLVLAAGHGIFRASRKKIFSLTDKFTIGLTVSLILLLPVLGMFEIYFMRYSFVAEHWLTVAMFGFLAPAAEYLSRIKLNDKIINLLFVVAAITFSSISFSHLQNFSSEKKLLQQNIIKNPESILAYNRLALVLKAEGNLEAAKINLEKALMIKPTAQSYYNLAMIDMKQTNMVNAKMNFEKSIQLNPYFSDSYNSLATVYIGMQQYQPAITQLEQALKLEPRNALALYNLGYSYEKMNRRTEALNYYKMALSLQPSNFTIQQAVQELQK